MPSRIPIVLLGTALGLASGCSKKEARPRQASRHDRTRSNIAAYVLDQAPAFTHPLDTSFDDHVELLGYDLEPKGAVPSKAEVKLTLYWQLKAPLGGLWKLSTSVLDDTGKKVLDLNRASPIRAGRPGHPRLRPTRWSVGKVYVDKLTFRAPDSGSTHFRVIAGVYTNQTLNMRVTHGERTDDLHALVTELAVAAESPTVSLTKLDASTRIHIDGKLDETAWRTAPELGPLLHVGEADAGGKLIRATARMLWNAQSLFVAYEVEDHDVSTGPEGATRHADFEGGDAVALVVDPDRDGRGDYEVRINPRNVVYDAERAQARGGPAAVGPRPQTAWSSLVQSAVAVKGTLDKADDDDTGYVVEARIPWSSFERGKRVAPTAGDAWKLNLYALDRGAVRGWAPAFGKEGIRDGERFGQILFARDGAGASTDPAVDRAPAPPSSSVTPRPDRSATPVASASPAAATR